MKETKDKWVFKISLLSISLFLMMAPQISTALPLMYQAFPGVSSSAVETLATIPNFGIVAGLFLSPLLVNRMGAKATVITGLVITLLSGTFPMYVSQYVSILISRFIIGLGIGLFNSLAVSLVSDFYRSSEEETATMLGFQGVMGTIGSAIASFLVSYLVTISWHAAFAIYFLVIPSLILFTLFVPMEKKSQVKQATQMSQSQSLNRKDITIAGIMFFLFLFYMPMAYKLPVVITGEKLANLSELALITGASTLIGIPFGAAFGFFFKRLHDKIFPIGMCCVTIGFIGLAFSPSLVLMVICLLVLGFGFSLAVPYMYNWLSWSAPEGSMNLATTVVLIMVNLGVFLSPSVMGLLSTLFGSSLRSIFYASSAGCVLLSLYAILHYYKVHSPSLSKADEKAG